MQYLAGGLKVGVQESVIANVVFSLLFRMGHFLNVNYEVEAGLSKSESLI